MTAVSTKNLVDEVWGDARPPRPENPIFHLSDEHTGETSLSKIDRIVKVMKEDADYLLVTTLDDIAWTLNCRGSDIEYNPVFFSYLLIDRATKHSTLYVLPTKTKDVADYFKTINVTVLPYDTINEDLKKLVDASKKIMTDTGNANAEICQVLASQSVNHGELIERMKAEKNIVEQRGMRDCHIRDMAALVKYFAWLEDQLKTPGHGLNEYTAALKLEEFRSKGDKFKGLSFETISSIGPNGAVIHYAPSST